MKLTLICTFILFVLVCNLAVSTAYPTTYFIDGDVRDFRDLDYDNDNTYNYRNSRLLRRIDDYDDDNSVYYKQESAKAPIRRADSESDIAYKYTPLVRYKSTRTQRKKLFVPNLFG